MLSLPAIAKGDCQEVIDAADAVIKKQDEMLGLCQKNYFQIAEDNDVLSKALIAAQDDAQSQRNKTVIYSIASFALGVLVVSVGGK